MSGFPFTALPDPLAGFMGAYLQRGGQGRKEHGEGKEMGGAWREGKRSAPFPTSSAVTAGHGNKLNENHRLDSDLSTYNKLGGVRPTLCITEMATH